MIDTHTHVYLPEFDQDREEVIERALQAGVTHLILPATEPESLPAMKAMKQKWPANISMAVGLHPTDLGDDPKARLAIVNNEAITGSYVAIGEIGMDLYWDKSRLDEQMQVFDAQMRLAAEVDLPVIIHCREALDPTLEVISGLERVPSGVFHSFSGTAQDVDKIRRYGDFYFGLNGVATFKNCHVTDAVSEITFDRLLLETDAPYLAPVPKRGRRNEPSFVVHTCHHIASAIGCTPDEIASSTTLNAKKLFAL